MLTKVSVSRQLLRQCFAAVVSGWVSLTSALALGFSATLLPELKIDKSFPFDDTFSSFIASITPLAMVIGCLFAGPLIDGVGRKIGHIVLAVLSSISWLIIGFSRNNTLLLIGRFIAGLSIGANRPVSLVYLGEITQPKYRSLILLSPSLFLSMSIILSHLIGSYLYWRTCCFIYAAANFFSFILVLFLKESPLWLISKGKIAEGKQSFLWFRGKENESEKELDLVLQRREEKFANYYFTDILSIGFMKPLLTATLLAVAVQFCGVNLFIFYALDIARSTFKGDIDAFISMIILDIIRFFSAIINFSCEAYLSRKSLFLIMNFACSFVLLGLVVYLLHSFRFIWLSITLGVLFMVFGGCIVSLGWSFVPELFPSNLRGLGSGVASGVSYFLLFVTIQLYPGFTFMFGQEAMYASFGVIIIVNSIFLYFLLPNTNGRTLQDIEDGYNKNRSN